MALQKCWAIFGMAVADNERWLVRFGPVPARVVGALRGMGRPGAWEHRAGKRSRGIGRQAQCGIGASQDRLTAIVRWHAARAAEG